VVDQLDLDSFLKAYRAGGHGRAAYASRMLLGVLPYAYCTGIRSSPQIERRCREDIGFRVLSGNACPDQVTIARFRVRHEQALGGVLVQSLRQCAAAGMVRLGLVALDGTKIEANAATATNRTHAHLRAQVADPGRLLRIAGRQLGLSNSLRVAQAARTSWLVRRAARICAGCELGRRRDRLHPVRGYEQPCY
jgi:transposase